MWKVSYAQNREDILLARALPAETGFYIDVGAADPLEFSVTKLFYDRGWCGVNVEPQDDYFRKLVADRPRDINLQVALSDRPGTVTLFVAPTHPGWATANEAVARQMADQGIEVSPREVPALTLAEVCEAHVRGPIDFLKVDVEGEERSVLLGGDFTRWRPRVVVVEATEQGGPTPNHHLWEDVLLGRDYLYAAFDGLNRYYVRAEDADLVPVLQVPVNVFDEYAPFEFQSRIWEHDAMAKHQSENAERFYREAEAVRAQLAEVERSRDGAWRECERLRDVIDALTREHEEQLARDADARRRLESAKAKLQALRDSLSRPPARR
jgi:FkbM family methyltransferase